MRDSALPQRKLSVKKEKVMRSHRMMVTCVGVDWEYTLSNDHDEDDDITEVGRAVTMPSKWDGISAVVDCGAVETRPEEGIGFCGAGGERGRYHGQRKFKVRTAGGRTAKSTWQVADVKRPLMSMAKMIAAGNCVHLDESDHRVVKPSGDVIPLRNAGYVFVMDLWVKRIVIGTSLVFHGKLEPVSCTCWS